MSFSWSVVSVRPSSRPSAWASGISEASQNVRPTTAACCTTRRSNGSSASRRAASTAWTVSGSSPPPRLPSSAIRRAISSANSGLPPERSTTRSTISSLSGSSEDTSARVSSAASGSSSSWVAERRPPPHPGRRSSSSSRVRQTRISGARTHCARCSMASSMPSSAQWMSSKAITSGCRRARASMPERRAEKKASRSALGVLLRGHQLRRDLDAEQAADQRGLALARLAERLGLVPEQAGHVGRSLRQASSAESVSTIPHSARSTSPSAQNTMPAP